MAYQNQDPCDPMLAHRPLLALFRAEQRQALKNWNRFRQATQGLASVADPSEPADPIRQAADQSQAERRRAQNLCAEKCAAVRALRRELKIRINEQIRVLSQRR